MGRFFTPTVESIGPGPSVQAPGDGLEGVYHGFLNSVPSGGQCLVVVPGLDPLHHLEAICAPNAAGSVGDAVLVNVDDQKQLWVVTGTTHTTEINGTPVPLSSSAWRTPTLINSWVNLGGGYETAAYLKDPIGFVHLKGVIRSGTPGSAAFVLPAGYRPGATTDNAVDASAVIQIGSAGSVVITSGSAAVALSGITFLAEN
jgi:hypothetical protein